MGIIIGNISGSDGVCIGNGEEDDKEIIIGDITGSSGISIGNK